MSRKDPSAARLSHQRGPYYRIANDGGGIEVRLDAVSGNGHAYSANWLKVEEISGLPHLCFGQKVGSVLVSRVDIRTDVVQLREFLKVQAEFVKKLAELLPPADASSWALSDEVPRNAEKYLLEDANVMLVSYSGSQAEIEFLMVPPRDIYAARVPNPEYKYRGPRPVVALSITTGQLRWLVEEIARYVANRMELL